MIQKIFSTLFIVFIITQTNAQLVINEVSQGTGTAEYVEFLVVGTKTCTDSCVNLQAWILDDNNGFFGSSGIAGGHIRFNNDPQWQCVPYGTIIVIYNAMSPYPGIVVDETDANNDNVYFLASNSSYFEANPTTPTSGVVSTTYAGTTYTAGGLNWSYLGMSNSNDAFQTVAPTALTSGYHSVGWGNTTGTNISFTGSASGLLFQNENSTNNDPYLQTNWAGQAVSSGSPGAGNTVANTAWINAMRNTLVPLSDTINETICNVDSFFFDNQYLHQAGIYNDTQTTGLGCDSIVTLNLSLEVCPVCVYQTYSLEDFEFSTAIPGLISNTTYQSTPQTFCPYSGTRSFYGNFQNGFAGEFYNNDFDVCPNAEMRFSFWTKDCFSSSNNISFEIRDANGLVISGPQTVVNAMGATWQQIVTPTFVSSTNSVTISMSTLTAGGPGNDISLDDFLFEICLEPSTTNDVVLCNANTINLYDSLIPNNLSLMGLWNGPSALSNGSMGTFVQNIQVDGLYDYTLAGFNNCPDTVNYVNVSSSLIINTINETICSGDSFLFNANYYSIAGSYTDTFASGFCDSLITLNLSLQSCFGCEMDLGNDTLVCGPVNQILNAGVFDEYVWQDGSTNQTFTATGTGEYYCQGTTYSTTNLVLNGDFQAGAVDFTTDYIPGTGGSFGLLTNPGTFAISTSPNLVHNNFLTCGDNTSGTGNMMIVNGSSSANSNVWCQTIPVNPNTDYIFSAWAMNADGVSTLPSQMAELRFSINGTVLGTTFFPSVTPCSWTQFNSSWNSALNTSITICIENTNLTPGGAGADFALDDIFFGEVCIVSDTINILSQTNLVDSAGIEICFGESAMIFGNSETAEGLYLDTLRTAAGCDSLYLKRYLEVGDDLFSNATVSICFGDSVFLQNAWQNTSGTYYDTLQSSTFCDSLITSVLNVSSAPVTTTIFTCTNILGNQGVVTDTVFSVSGCPTEFNITNTKYTTPTTYTTNVSICEGESEDVFGVLQTEAGVYFDTTFTSLGCDSILKEKTLIVNPSPTVSASQDTTILSGQNAILTANGADAYEWNTGITTSVLDLVLYETTTFSVTGSTNGCNDLDSVTVFVLDEEVTLLVPNAFSPNADGLNDVFRIVNEELFENIRIRVYNRWGDMVFDGKTNEAWDGRYNNIEQALENYTYYIEATAISNQEKFKLSGTVSLIR